MAIADKLKTVAENQEKVYRAGAAKFAAYDIPDTLEFTGVSDPDISDMSLDEKVLAIKKNQQKVYDAGLLKYAATKTSEASDFVAVTDSVGYKALDFGVEGKTEQVTYTGKNLFDISQIDVTTSGNNGITEVGDSYIIVTSVDGYSGNGLISTGKTLREVCPSLEVGQTYMLSGTTESTSLKRIYVGVAWNFGSTAVVTEDMLNATVIIYGHSYSDRIGSCKISNIQIEAGSTATAYEPYVGGASSPSPERPQEIVHAGKVGKNLWNAELAADMNNWVQNPLNTTHLMFPIYVGTGNPVMVSYQQDLPTGLGFYSGVVYTEANGISNWLYHSDNTTLINKTAYRVATSDYIYISAHKVNALESGKFMQYIGNDLQIEISSTATEYEPYGYEVGCTVSGKNLWDAEYAADANNWIKVPGSPYPSIPVFVGKGNTITVSYQQTLETGLGIFFAISKDGTNSNLVQWMYHNTSGGLIKNTYTFVSENDYIYLCYSLASGATFDILTQYITNDLQIEIGSTATEYEPYYEPTNFTLTSPVQLTKWDKLVKRDGVWGWSANSVNRLVTSKVTDWDLTYGWTAYTNSPEGIYTYQIQFNDKVYGPDNVFCTTYKMISGAYGANKAVLNSCSGISSGGRIFFNTNIPTLDEWKAYIDENPLDIWYQTTEEKAFHPLSDEGQVLLNNLETYQGGTNLHNDQGCPMWIKYIVDPATITE